MYTLGRALFKGLCCFLYPPLCLHCRSLQGDPDALFCGSCQLTLLDPKSCCAICFSPMIESEGAICEECLRRPPLLHRMAAAFSYEGSAASLVKEIKYAHRAYLAKGAAAYMAMQWAELNWPTPDLLVPVPISRIRRWQRGFNQSFELAYHLGLLLNRPVVELLGRCEGSPPQARLQREERLLLDSGQFFVKSGSSLSQVEDGVVFLIDDVITTGSTMRCCAELLAEFAPKRLYALGLCRAPS